jgi:hypothetical protein
MNTFSEGAEGLHTSVTCPDLDVVLRGMCHVSCPMARTAVALTACSSSNISSASDGAPPFSILCPTPHKYVGKDEETIELGRLPLAARSRARRSRISVHHGGKKA